MKPISLALLLFVITPAPAQDAIAGWRGNWTGLYPKSTAPLTWKREPRSIANGLRSQIDRPKPEGDAPEKSLVAGLVREWLVLGPFAVKDAVADFDAALIDEPKIAPSAGEKIG